MQEIILGISIISEQTNMYLYSLGSYSFNEKR